jgi:hypothetical protein
MQPILICKLNSQHSPQACCCCAYLQEVARGMLVRALAGACEHLESDLSIFTNFSRCPPHFRVGYQLSPVPIGVIDEKRSTNLVDQT